MSGRLRKGKNHLTLKILLDLARKHRYISEKKVMVFVTRYPLLLNKDTLSIGAKPEMMDKLAIKPLVHGCSIAYKYRHKMQKLKKNTETKLPNASIGSKRVKHDILAYPHFFLVKYIL